MGIDVSLMDPLYSFQPIICILDNKQVFEFLKVNRGDTALINAHSITSIIKIFV